MIDSPSIALEHRQPLRTPDHGDLDKQFMDAKSFILSATTKNGVNLYVDQRSTDDRREGIDDGFSSDTIILHIVFHDY